MSYLFSLVSDGRNVKRRLAYEDSTATCGTKSKTSRRTDMHSPRDSSPNKDPPKSKSKYHTGKLCGDCTVFLVLGGDEKLRPKHRMANFAVISNIQYFCPPL